MPEAINLRDSGNPKAAGEKALSSSKLQQEVPERAEREPVASPAVDSDEGSSAIEGDGSEESEQDDYR